MKMILKAVLIGSALGLCACGADPSVMDDYKSTSSQKDHKVEVSSAVINPPFNGRTTSAGFMTLQNKGANTRLVSASSPISPRVEIHTHLKEDGIMKMRRVEGIDIAAGETITLKPGSYHLMMFDTVLADDMVEAPLTLTYSDGTDVTMIVPIEGRSEQMDHSKMDHGKMDHSKMKHGKMKHGTLKEPKEHK